jgi:hypothetical protein
MVDYICCMKDLIYELSPNLHVKGNQVISYTTVIGHIKDGTLYVKGKYSRTTTKHVLFALSVLKLNIDNTSWKKKPEEFHKYEMGVKCEFEGAIPPYLSIAILGREEGTSILEAIASLESIRKKDWDFLKIKLGLPPSCPPPQKKDTMFTPLPEGPRPRKKKI